MSCDLELIHVKSFINRFYLVLLNAKILFQIFLENRTKHALNLVVVGFLIASESLASHGAHLWTDPTVPCALVRLGSHFQIVIVITPVVLFVYAWLWLWLLLLPSSRSRPSWPCTWLFSSLRHRNSWCPVTICKAKQETNTGSSSPSGTLLFPLHFPVQFTRNLALFVNWKASRAQKRIFTSAVARRQYDAHLLFAGPGQNITELSNGHLVICTAD